MRRLSTLLILCLLSLPALAGGFNQDNFGGPGFSQYVSAAPTTPMIQPVMASFIIPAISGTRYAPTIGSMGSGGSVATTTRGIPVPIATSISGLEANIPASVTGGAATDNIVPSTGTPASGTVTCSLASAANCADTSHSDSLAAGDTLQVGFSATGTFTTGAAQFSLLSTPTDGASGFFGSIGSIGTLSAAQYLGPNIGFSQSTTSNSTEADASAVLPIGITVTGLFVDPNGTSGAAVDIATLCKNGTCSGITCTLPASSATGCCVQSTVTGHIPRGSASCSSTSSIHFAVGDTISIQFTCSTTGSCTALNIGASLSYVPDNAGQAVITAQPFNNINATSYAAVHDWELQSTNINWMMLPYMNGKTAHFGSLLICSDTNSGGSATRTFTSQLGASPGTAPTTLAGASTVTLSVANGACPGANSGTLLGGNQDTLDTWTASAGETTNYVQTIGGSPTTGNHTYKLAITSTIK